MGDTEQLWKDYRREYKRAINQRDKAIRPDTQDNSLGAAQAHEAGRV